MVYEMVYELACLHAEARQGALDRFSYEPDRHVRTKARGACPSYDFCQFHRSVRRETVYPFGEPRG
jgi:hypothetical protein